MKLKKSEKSELFVSYPGFWRDLLGFLFLSSILCFIYVIEPYVNEWILKCLLGIKDKSIAIFQPFALYVIILWLLYYVLGFCNNKKNLVRCILGTTAFVACIMCLELFQGTADSYYYYDIVYVGIAIVIISWWGAALLYGLLRFHAATILAIIIFLVAGGLLYEWLAAKGILDFPHDRFSRPLLVIETVLGVIKRKDLVDDNSRLAPFLFYAFHGIMAFFGGYIVVGMVSKATANALLLRSMRKKPDCVMWDSSPESIAMARDLRKHGMLCIFVQNDLASENEEATGTLIKDNFLWVLKGWGASQSILQKIPRHFFLSPDSSKNVEKATQLSKIAKKDTDVYVRIEDEADDSWLFRWAEKEDIKENLNVHIVRETSLVADLLLSTNQTLLAPGIKLKGGKVESVSSKGDSLFRLLQIGFGVQGQMLFNRTLCDVQAPGLSFDAIALDPRQESFDLYDVRCPDVRKKYRLHFIKMDFLSKSFFEWLGKEISSVEFTRIFITTDNDDLNLNIADFIIKRYKETGDVDRLNILNKILFVRVQNPEKYADLPPYEKENDLKFTPFGSNSEVYSYENLLNLGIDIVAKKINARWSESKNLDKEWRKASFFNRESSRASAVGLRNLWLLSGPSEAFPSKEAWEQKLKDNNGLLENLCDAEHMRWMAFHYVHGIKTWNPETEPLLIKNAVERDENKLLKTSKLQANQRIRANCHAALIPTERLFRTDIYLDITSFKELKSSYKLFGFYEQKLKEYWEVLVILCDGCPTEQHFSCNRRLLALNHCVFALYKAAACIDTLKIPKNAFDRLKQLLKDFSDNLTNAYKNDQDDRQLFETLHKFALDVKKEADAGSWCGSDEISKCAVKIEALAKPESLSFLTLENLIGNDEDIIIALPEYLKDFQSNEDANKE